MDKKTNRLIHEKSPYLLQHAYNPVDWYPWGKEAFDKARREDKPVFLSIGYSTCHWCHVMEKECFEDEEVANVLNNYFISIKVDREERPDIDHIYMAACQRLTGQGGWPLTVIMTPDKKPFFAGTYFPKERLIHISETIHNEWQKNKTKLLQYSNILTQTLHTTKPTSNEPLSIELLHSCFSRLKDDFDSLYGGFGRAPKFPVPHVLMFLLRYWYTTGNCEALSMVSKTLINMRNGGIYDHLGYGFSRYSVDNKWLVPHFEKMLYDNALLIYTYLEAYQCTGNNYFSQTAEEVIEYILRDMTSDEGGFFSAEDADSEGIEGKFYVWSYDEIVEILGQESSSLFCKFYNITPQGNFEGKNILNTISNDLNKFASENNMTSSKMQVFLKNCRSKLYYLRSKRIRPFKDTKILTSWNALMIAALAKAGRTLDNHEYTMKAERAFDFLSGHLVNSNRIMAVYHSDADKKNIPGYIDDYAYILWSLIELYESTFKTNYLLKAHSICDAMLDLFWDNANGGFYFYGSDAEKLLLRPKEIYDGALPSGNSVAALMLLKLSDLNHDEKIKKIAEKNLLVFKDTVVKNPEAYTYFLMAVDYYLSKAKHIKIKGIKKSPDTLEMIKAIHSEFLPTAAVSLSYHPNGKMFNETSVEICEDFTCLPPITNSSDLKNHIKQAVPKVYQVYSPH